MGTTSTHLDCKDRPSAVSAQGPSPSAAGEPVPMTVEAIRALQDSLDVDYFSISKLMQVGLRLEAWYTSGPVDAAYMETTPAAPSEQPTLRGASPESISTTEEADNVAGGRGGFDGTASQCRALRKYTKPSEALLCLHAHWLRCVRRAYNDATEPARSTALSCVGEVHARLQHCCLILLTGDAAARRPRA